MIQILFLNIVSITAKSVDLDEIRGPPRGGELGKCFIASLKLACSPVCKKINEMFSYDLYTLILSLFICTSHKPERASNATLYGISPGSSTCSNIFPTEVTGPIQLKLHNVGKGKFVQMVLVT